jgi:hypothetical protein
MRKLERIFRQLTKLYVLDIVSWELNPKGYKLVCAAPADIPDRETVRNHFLACYGDRREMPDFDDDDIYLHWAERLRNISCFAKDLQQRFTQWYNHKFMDGARRGTVWADRFKNAIISSAQTLLEAIFGVDPIVRQRKRERKARAQRQFKERWARFLRQHPLLAELPWLALEGLHLIRDCYPSCYFQNVGPPIVTRR